MNIHNIPFKTSSIRYSDQGQGKTIILLHGYLESLEIWNGFKDELAKKFRVIAIDLPGHGKSGIPEGNFTVELMAEAIKSVIDHLKLDKVVIIAHSMGGYALLAFAELWPEKLAGIGLFHSITWTDSPEKRDAREREIELVKQGKKNLIYNINVPKGFADDNLEKFKKEVDRAINIAYQTSDEGIIGALNAMKKRKDRTYILEKIEVPVFFGIGKKDNYIPFEKLLTLISIPKRKYVVIFENSGHMGFIEEKESSLDEIENYLELC